MDRSPEMTWSRLAMPLMTDAAVVQGAPGVCHRVVHLQHISLAAAPARANATRAAAGARGPTSLRPFPMAPDPPPPARYPSR